MELKMVSGVLLTMVLLLLFIQGSRYIKLKECGSSLNYFNLWNLIFRHQLTKKVRSRTNVLWGFRQSTPSALCTSAPIISGPNYWLSEIYQKTICLRVLVELGLLSTRIAIFKFMKLADKTKVMTYDVRSKLECFQQIWWFFGPQLCKMFIISLIRKVGLNYKWYKPIDSLISVEIRILGKKNN